MRTGDPATGRRTAMEKDNGMKQITNVAIGGRNFIISNDAYAILDSWLEKFRARVEPASQADDVMVEIEERIAELFSEAATVPNYVVDVDLVRKVTGQLGMPDGSDPDNTRAEQTPERPVHRFYRDSDDKKLAGVCSGIAKYFNIDVLLVRVIAVILVFCGTSGLWAYIILWFISPLATTPLEKCELQGLAPTAENLRRFKNSK